MVLNLFFHSKECKHKNINIEMDFAYCPDCGECIENRWYMTRCKCCNIKRKTTIRGKNIEPISKFCPNCGAVDFEIEFINKINFIDINFAVLQKTILPKKNNYYYTQIWEETKNYEAQRLLKMN